MSPRRYRITVAGKTFEVEVGDLAHSPARVVVDGAEYHVDLPGRSPARSQTAPAQVAPSPAASARPAGAPAPAPGAVTAMMPGRVISVEVKRGDQVRRGQTVCIIESMKMEQRIASPRDARVTAVRVSAGDPVQRGQTLVELE